MKKAKKIVVISTKGGCGKSIIANFIAPYYFIRDMDEELTKEKINLSIVELEATNTSREESYKESIVTYINNKMIDEESIQDFFIDALFDVDQSTIFDIGGGRDSLMATKEIIKVGHNLDDFVFIFPFNLTQDSFDGAYETYKKLKNEIENINAVFVLNRMVYKLDESGVPTKEFLDYSDILKESGRAGIAIEKLNKENVQITYIPEFFETLPKKLFQANGCCIDLCKKFLSGKSASEQRGEIYKDSQSLPDKEDAKAYYKKETQKVIEASEMFRILGFSKPFFDSIDRAVNNKKRKA